MAKIGQFVNVYVKHTSGHYIMAKTGFIDTIGGGRVKVGGQVFPLNCVAIEAASTYGSEMVRSYGHKTNGKSKARFAGKSIWDSSRVKELYC